MCTSFKLSAAFIVLYNVVLTSYKSLYVKLYVVFETSLYNGWNIRRELRELSSYQLSAS
jgi:hypothetical protein